jgi:hypothetical protein
MREQQIPELQGTSILTKSFFNKLIRRIECTKPLAGSGITIKEQENGFEIASSGGGGGSAISSSAVTFELNVCSNGVPDTIIVYGVEPEA